MVVFTCNHCGDSLQKPKVAKHYQFQCRNYPDLTCVDCHKDYRGEEYIEHTKCITENERYGGQDYIAKANSNKGERKQNEWINIVQNLLNNATNLTVPERNFLNQISHYQNIPRKKAKFFNFIKSSLGNRVNWSHVETVWTKMEMAFKETNANKQQLKKEDNGTQNNHNVESSVAENQNNENMIKETVEEVREKKKKSKKRKLDAENDSSEVIMERPNVDNENIYTEENNENDEFVTEKKMKKNKKRKVESGNNSLNINNENNENSTKEDEDAEEAMKKKNKKRKIKEENVSQRERKTQNIDNSNTVDENKNNENENKVEQFNWQSTIIEILNKKNGVPMKKLRKKAISRYMRNCPGRSEEKAVTKFEKKIKKMNSVEVENEIVRIMKK